MDSVKKSVKKNILKLKDVENCRSNFAKFNQEEVTVLRDIVLTCSTYKKNTLLFLVIFVTNIIIVI